jgi:DNA-binding transcriptional ArsR family regulator
MKPITNIEDPRLVKAMAHPLRIRILGVLEDRVASPKELSEELSAPLGNVAYHVRTLEELGLVTLERTATRRGAIEHWYRAVERVGFSDSAWGQVPEVVKRSVMAASLNQLAEQVKAAAAAGAFDQPDIHFSRSVIDLDAQGWEELSEELKALVDRVDELERAAEARLRESGEEPRKAALAVMQFDAAPRGEQQPEAEDEASGGAPLSNGGHSVN